MHLTQGKSDAKAHDILFNIESRDSMPNHAVSVGQGANLVVRFVVAYCCTVKEFKIVVHFYPKRPIISIFLLRSVQLDAHLVRHFLAVVGPFTFPFLMTFITVGISDFQ
jgi:hypothetical protein